MWGAPAGFYTPRSLSSLLSRGNSREGDKVDNNDRRPSDGALLMSVSAAAY